MTIEDALDWADMTPWSSAWAVLAAEVRRLREDLPVLQEDRTRLLDEAAKIVEVHGKALASGDRYYSRLAVHALLDKLAADIRAAVRGGGMR